MALRVHALHVRVIVAPLQFVTGTLPGARIRPPACDEAAWVFLGLSMAGWNVLVSLGLVVLSTAAALRERSRA